MTDTGIIGAGAYGKILPRAMGHPILINNLGFGASSSVYADIINLAGTTNVPGAQRGRIFCGLSCYNPDSTNTFYIAFGSTFNSNAVFAVAPGETAAWDNLTFGPSFSDPFTSGSNAQCKVIRGLLSGTKGTAGQATINYSGSGNPTDKKCVFINNCVYEFTSNENDSVAAAAALSAGANYQAVAIGASAATTWASFATVFNAFEQGAAAVQTTNVITFTSTYAGVAAGTAFALADGDASAANTTVATFNHANLATGAVNGTIPIINIW
jgi:hypothetical protein